MSDDWLKVLLICTMKPKYGYYDVFVRTCAKYPSGTAVKVYEDGKYTSYAYSELYGVCEYIVQNIQQVTCDKGIIGLITDRNPLVPSLIAACHKCSLTFMFIDPSQDIDVAIRDTKLSITIHVRNLHQSKTDLCIKIPDKNITVFNYEISIYKYQSDCQFTNFIQEHSFIAKTSGSTGDAKYIQVPIRCLQPNVDDLTKIFNITSNDVIYFSTPLTFDPSMVEVLLACTNAASLLIAPERADVLFSNIKGNSVTFWQTTPSKFFQYSDADIRGRILGAESTLKVLALGGEPLSGIRRLRELKDVANATRIYTLYGVTEMSCWACVAELDLDKITDDNEVSLGNCLSETELFVKKDKENIGNIVLVSKTRKCVILSDTENIPGDSEVLDTGDIGEIRDGTVYYRGRRDDVIKRFGNKVSLQNIEATVMKHPHINSCSCIWLPEPRLLVLYYTSLAVKTQELKDFLKPKLSDKQWPDKIMRLENLPMSPHGKTSKSILSQMIHESELLPQKTDVKTLFTEEMKVILNKSFTFSEISRKDFFSIGGSSILAVLMCNKLSQHYTNLGKQILPYLLNPKYCIEEIIDILLKEMDVPKKKSRKRKFSLSKTSVTAAQSHISTVNICYQIVWSHNTGKCVDASPTLFKHEFKTYATVGSHSGKIVVADANSGEIHGIVTVNSRVEAAIVCVNILSQPCGIVGTYNGTVVCFRLQDCEVLWKINIGCMIKSKGVVHNEELYVASYDGNIRVIDVINGTVKESIHIVDLGISADLVLAQNNCILVGTLSGVCACVDTATKRVRWRVRLGSPVFATPALYQNEKYVVFAEVNGLLQCRTVKSGKKVWEYSEAKGHIFSSIYFKKLNKGWKMIFGCHDNNVYCVVIKNSQPALCWKTLLTSPVYCTPCDYRDKYLIAISNNGVLCIISSAKGHIVSEYRFPHEVFSSPIFWNDNIYVGCRDDSLYCIKCVVE